MDRKGANIIMYPVFVIIGVALIVLSMASSSWMLLLCAALLGFGYGNIHLFAKLLPLKAPASNVWALLHPLSLFS